MTKVNITYRDRQTGQFDNVDSVVGPQPHFPYWTIAIDDNREAIGHFIHSDVIATLVTIGPKDEEGTVDGVSPGQVSDLFGKH